MAPNTGQLLHATIYSFISLFMNSLYSDLSSPLSSQFPLTQPLISHGWFLMLNVSWEAVGCQLEVLQVS